MTNVGKLIGTGATLIGMGIFILGGWLFYSGMQKQEQVEVEKTKTVEVNTDSLATPTFKIDPSVRGQLAGTESEQGAENTIPAVRDGTGYVEAPVEAAPPALTSIEQVYHEAEIARLKAMLETDLKEDLADKQALWESYRSKAAPSTFAGGARLASLGGIGADNTGLTGADNSALHGAAPSLVTPTINQLFAPQSRQNQAARQIPGQGVLPFGNAGQGAPTNAQIASLASDPVGYSQYSPEAPRSPYEVKKGTVIPAALVTEINSDIPGNAVGMIRHDVFDTVTGRHLLIPEGSRIFGLYDDSIEFAQNRLNVVWTHLIFPNGDTLVLEDQQATDIAGQAGFKDQRKGRFLQTFAGNLLYSVLDAGEQAVTARVAKEITGELPQSQSELASAISSVGSQFGGGGNGSAASVFNDQQAKRGPTLRIRSGYRFNILVSKDIILEPYR
jgi:type IV secretory pathway VirB10-like protein